MKKNLKEALLESPQAQGPLIEQLRELIKLAEENGLYDAADWLKQRVVR